jgi:predicted Zn finger-like uncharacterized protein
MFTVCPKCALTLVVTAADLRVAQGYVRCGRCSSVFNALARLSDERQLAVTGAQPSAQSTAEPAEPPQAADLSPLEEALMQPGEIGTTGPADAAEEAIPEGALEFNPDTTDVGAVFVQPPPNPQWTAATGSFKAMRAATQEPAAPEAPPAEEPSESQVDVEIDAAFLAEMLQEPTRKPEPQQAEPQQAEPQQAEPQQTEPQQTEPQQTEPQQAEPQQAEPQQAEPQQPRPARRRPAQPPRAAHRAAPLPAARAPQVVGPEQGATTPPRVANRAVAPAVTSSRDAARHASLHTRPPAGASVRPRAAHEQAPRAHAARTATPTEEPPPSASLDSSADETAVARYAMYRAPLARLGPGAWGALAALALLMLLAQIVNHYRDELAVNPRFSRPLTALYGSLGVQLVPHWDLRSYDVRQLGASADPAGTGLITLRASIKNSGHQAQPLPLLRVTLQDRFGNRIAARDVAPRFYVPHTMPDSSYLAGGQRIDAEMGFVDPGANAVGFEIDACLPASGGGVTCANDLAAR